MLTIRLVDPSEDPTVVGTFCSEQAFTYSEFDAETAVTPVTEEEVKRKCIYFVVAEEALSGRMVGGLRLYLRPKGTQLPVERLLHQYTAFIAEIQEKWARRGIAEIGGLWVNNRWRGMGLSVAMFRVATAAMPQLNATRALAFSHHHVIPSWAPLGWTVDPVMHSIGYPDARYKTSIVWVDPLTLEHAWDHERTLARKLRSVLSHQNSVPWSIASGQSEDVAGLYADAPHH